MLLPRTSNQLFTLWAEAIGARASWSELHGQILARFLPPIRAREICAFEIDRPQRFDEPFAGYVEDIISSAFALRVNLTESDVIDIALTKCVPEVKMHSKI